MCDQRGDTAVLLVAHGSPERVRDIPEFLLRVTGGRQLPAEAVKEVEDRYTAIGHSPLTAITLKQGELLAAKLGMRVYVGMRNWHPLVRNVVAEMAGEGMRRAIVICMAPQNSRTSVGLYRSSLPVDDQTLVFDFVESWHDQPLLIQAFAEKLVAGRNLALREAGFPLPVIFTAHSVPERTILEGDPYEAQTKDTAAGVARAAGLGESDWRLAFQSQGMSRGPWLGPTLEETMAELCQEGFHGVFFQPIGFLCDHVEVLYDIDIMARRSAEQRSMRMWRAESLNEAPLLISALAEIVHSRLHASPGP
ncbi:MAG: ferrochelatase [Acidobacteria bacterium]|nr:ferrochelatase [Acidobacteriota bacterium]